MLNSLYQLYNKHYGSPPTAHSTTSSEEDSIVLHNYSVSSGPHTIKCSHNLPLILTDEGHHFRPLFNKTFSGLTEHP